eukprot:1194718-Prorocentrum_minimum.AAC.18
MVRRHMVPHDSIVQTVGRAGVLPPSSPSSSSASAIGLSPSNSCPPAASPPASSPAASPAAGRGGAGVRGSRSSEGVSAGSSGGAKGSSNCSRRPPIASKAITRELICEAGSRSGGGRSARVGPFQTRRGGKTPQMWQAQAAATRARRGSGGLERALSGFRGAVVCTLELRANLVRKPAKRATGAPPPNVCSITIAASTACDLGSARSGHFKQTLRASAATAGASVGSLLAASL